MGKTNLCSVHCFLLIPEMFFHKTSMFLVIPAVCVRIHILCSLKQSYRYPSRVWFSTSILQSVYSFKIKDDGELTALLSKYEMCSAESHMYV